MESKKIEKSIQAFDEYQQSSPYHLNIIEELHANENAHSRILAKLFQYKNTNEEYIILKSFVEYIKENNKAKSFDKIEIKAPKITQEEERIDIWIQDENYAIIIENKVYEAGDQDAQLSRYIDKTKQQHYKEKEIFVIYMPSVTRDTSEQTWGEYRDRFTERFAIVSFCDDVISWLSKYVLPNLTLKEVYLKSAIEQYIDYLERYAGLFEKSEQQRILKKIYGIQEIETTDPLDTQYSKLMNFHKELNLYMEACKKKSEDIFQIVLDEFISITKSYYGDNVKIYPEKNHSWIQIYKQEWSSFLIHFEWLDPSFFEGSKLTLALHAEKNKKVWEYLKNKLKGSEDYNFPTCFEESFYIKNKESFAELSEEEKEKFLFEVYKKINFLIDVVDSCVKKLMKVESTK